MNPEKHRYIPYQLDRPNRALKLRGCPDNEQWRFLTGRPDARSDDQNKMALHIHSHMFGLGGAISVFEGRRTTG